MKKYFDMYVGGVGAYKDIDGDWVEYPIENKWEKLKTNLTPLMVIKQIIDCPKDDKDIIQELRNTMPELIESEKQNIIDAYDSGFIDGDARGDQFYRNGEDCFSELMNKGQNPERSVATEADSSNADD